MSTTEGLRNKIATAQELQSVVKTMKALSMVSIRQYEKAVQSLAEYNHTLEMGLQVLLQRNQSSFATSDHPHAVHYGLVILGSDQGMCGRFNELVAEEVQAFLRSQKTQYHRLIAVGERLVNRLQDQGETIALKLSTPGSLAGITAVVYEIVQQLQQWCFPQGTLTDHPAQLDQIHLIYNRPTGGAGYLTDTVQIFPLDQEWLRELQKRPWPSRCQPWVNLPTPHLWTALFRQIFFVSLYRACAESLASEHASRLAAMQQAETNIAERLGDLQMDFQQLRQSQITEELLDIVAGYESLKTTHS
ncbi:MAG: ATPase F1F0 subunit gamma [Synechococcaceae cyanobacterium SM2_3_1]|nr:ATPase F1F0 subunit gamma [Synechococcaceae cyanobacterium SM2_3_1]